MTNSAVEKTFGYSNAELIGQEFSLLLARTDDDEYGCDIKRYLCEEQSHLVKQRCETDARRKDGAFFPIEIWFSSSPHDGSPVFLAMIRDITERKNNEH